jgi:hypothetical protein
LYLPRNIEQIHEIYVGTEERNIETITMPVVKKDGRRKNGSGSIWESNGKYGLCVILQSGGKGKQLIRHVEYKKTLAEIEERMKWVQANKNELLQLES